MLVVSIYNKGTGIVRRNSLMQIRTMMRVKRTETITVPNVAIAIRTELRFGAGVKPALSCATHAVSTQDFVVKKGHCR